MVLLDTVKSEYWHFESFLYKQVSIWLLIGAYIHRYGTHYVGSKFILSKLYFSHFDMITRQRARSSLFVLALLKTQIFSHVYNRHCLLPLNYLVPVLFPPLGLWLCAFRASAWMVVVVSLTKVRTLAEMWWRNCEVKEEISAVVS